MKKLSSCLLMCACLIFNTQAQWDEASLYEVSKDVVGFSKQFIQATKESDYELFIDKRLLKPAVIEEINNLETKPISTDRLQNEIRYLNFKIQDKLNLLKKVTVSQGVDWSNISISGIDQRKESGKGEIMLSLSSNGRIYIVKIDKIETYTGYWKIGLETDFQLLGTKNQVVEAKNIIKSVYLSLKTNDFTHIHKSHLMNIDQMYTLMDSSGKFKDEEILRLDNSRINPQKIEQKKQALLESARKYRLKYIRGITKSIQSYHQAGRSSNLKWSESKVSNVHLDLNLSVKYGLGVADLIFDFTDGKEIYQVRINDCFIINGHLTMGFNIKIDQLDPEAILVRKMMRALTTDYFDHILQSLVPGEDLLKAYHKTDIRDVLPRELAKDFIFGRVNMLNQLRAEFRQIVVDGNLSGVQWPQVKLVDDNFGVQKTKIKKDLFLLSITFDIRYKELEYSIVLEKCVLDKDNLYVLTGMNFIKIE